MIKLFGLTIFTNKELRTVKNTLITTMDNALKGNGLTMKESTKIQIDKNLSKAFKLNYELGIKKK